MRTFTEFKNDFYSRFSDPAVFDCGDINLLKVVLDGLKVQYATRGPVNTRMFGSKLIFRLQLWRNAKRNHENHTKKIAAFKAHVNTQTVWGIDYTGRGVSDGKGNLVSGYYDRLRTLFPQNEFVILNDKPGKTPYNNAISIEGLAARFSYVQPDAEDWVLRDLLVEAEARFVAGGLVRGDERLSVRAAFQKFFDEYRGWKRLLQVAKPKQVFFTMHYHREGFLLALKRAGVKSIELQHGLIAPEDIFYVMPKSISTIRNRAMYADEIWVYGDFWKNRLLQGGEYGENEIRVIGWYPRIAVTLNSPEYEALKQFIGTKKCVLVCTQTSLHEFYISLISALAQTLLDAKHEAVIIVKPHPHETTALYQALEKYTNIKIAQGPLDDFVQLATVHASIYSTTHYDAQRHGLRSFAWSVTACADYVKAVIASGVAENLAQGEDILKRMQTTENQTMIPATHFYAPFQEGNY